MGTVFIRGDTPLPARHPLDHYRTPPDFVEKGLDVVERVALHERCPHFRTPALACRDPRTWFPTVLDPGAGDGVWGEAAVARWKDAEVVGVEVRPTPMPPAYVSWHVQDFFDFDWEGFDLVVGNPPYRGITRWIEHSLARLRHGGILVFLTHLSFLESKSRGDGLFVEHPPFLVAVCKERPRFTGPANPSAACFVAWVKGYQGPTELIWA